MAKAKKKHYEKSRFVITQLKRFDYGREQMNRMVAPISFVLSLFTLLKVYNVAFTFDIIITFILVSIILLFFVGYIWDRSGLVEEEIEYGNERNRFVRAILESKYHKAWLNHLQKAKIRK